MLRQAVSARREGSRVCLPRTLRMAFPGGTSSSYPMVARAHRVMMLVKYRPFSTGCGGGGPGRLYTRSGASWGNAASRGLAGKTEAVSPALSGATSYGGPSSSSSSSSWSFGRFLGRLTLGLLVAGAATVDILLPEFIEEENRKNALQALQQGSSHLAPDPAPGSSMVLAPRVALASRVGRLVTPRVGRAGYAVLFGEAGTGKTTLVRQAVRDVGGEGVLYVDVGRGYDGDVEAALDKAMKTKAPYQSLLIAAKEQLLRTLNGVGPKTAVSGPSGVSPGLVRAFKDLEDAAELYRGRTGGKAPVLVLDNVERLARRCPQALRFLQEAAKEAAADATLSVVFVCSDGRTLRDMRGKGCWSRAIDVLEVGDLSDAEATRYLVETRQMKAKEGKRAVALLGGRLVHLNRVAEEYASGESWEAIERKAWQSMEASFSLLIRLLQADAAPLLTTLLNEPSGVLSYEDVAWLTKNRAEQVLEEDSAVLSLDATGWSVRFQSRMARQYARALYASKGGMGNHLLLTDGDGAPSSSSSSSWWSLQSVTSTAFNAAVLGAAGYWFWQGGAAAALGPAGEQASDYLHEAATHASRMAQEALTRAREAIDRALDR